MTDNLSITILPDGHIKVKRGNSSHNNKIREVVSHIVDNDPEIMKELDVFLKGSENVKILFGDTIMCG